MGNLHPCTTCGGEIKLITMRAVCKDDACGEGFANTLEVAFNESRRLRESIAPLVEALQLLSSEWYFIPKGEHNGVKMFDTRPVVEIQAVARAALDKLNG